MKIFFLDDDKQRHKRFLMNRIGMDITVAWTCAEACQRLSETVFDVAYLDHDLSELAAAGKPAKDEKTGAHVAEFIASMPEEARPKFVVLHSFNPSGRMRMSQILTDAGVRCRMEPFEG